MGGQTLAHSAGLFDYRVLASQVLEQTEIVKIVASAAREINLHNLWFHPPPLIRSLIKSNWKIEDVVMRVKEELQS